MIIDGTTASDKTNILAENYVSLLNSGVPASQVLVLVQNSNLKNSFIEHALSNLTVQCFEKLQVHSFSSLVYNTINDNWAFLENKNPFPSPKILPNLTGMEVSQFILKDILKKIPFKGYNSSKSLLHQIFRRYSLIVQNNLSDDEVEFRSNVLGEAFGEDAKCALKELLKKTLYLRDFDYLRQTLVFEHVMKNTDYFSDIEYLILDDGDEITPVCYNFIKLLQPQLKKVFIAFDSKGSSRIGYLSADKTSVWEFEKLFNEPVIKIETSTKLKTDAENLFDNVIKNSDNILENFTLQSPSRRSKMIELACEKINELLKEKVSPNDIVLVTPVVDEMLKFSLRENLLKTVELHFLTGSEKLVQNRMVLACLTLLKMNTNLREKLTEFDLRSVLVNLLNIPLKYCGEILLEFDKNKELIEYDFGEEIYTKKYENLRKIVEKISTDESKLSEQIFLIYDNLFEVRNFSSNEIRKFNFFIKQIEDFENVFGENFRERKEEIITQIENSIIAENPSSGLEIANNEIIVGTPQKIIDNRIQPKYQIWLDISSNDWVKSDTGPLYNAWVFQKGWDKDEYTVEDNVRLSREKTARILRKLTLCASEKIHAYFSLFDGNGIENFGGIEGFIKTKKEEENPENNEKNPSPKFKIIPRDDQKPVLEYKSGQMAISAVPGAGKTTILLALIIKLLERGIDPKNIFVMTYMESAARNFRDRIKSVREDAAELPYISTIHGLALRILKENSNFERLGLSGDFDICDDTQKGRIIAEITKKMQLDKNDFNEFVQGISVFKIGGGSFTNLKTNDKKLIKFKNFFEKYQQLLKENNLIDYDDILVMSVKLLEENEDIRNYYQDICGYIIEDEAQDSSFVQQRLINILSGKHKNLIRCGDINQAITTTFTNADVKGFRKFIETSQNVSMDCSQRCTKEVWELANKLVLDAEQIPETKEAFYHILMHPVAGRNPVSENAVKAQIFEKPLDEKNFVLKEIKSELRKNPKTTVGILVRNNRQVIEWANFITNSGLKCISGSESLEQKSIFRAIFAVLKMVLSPFDNEVVANSYSTLAELGFYRQKFTEEIRNSKTPFIKTPSDSVGEKYVQQFLWDLNYWTGFPHLTADELAIKIGLYYFNGEIEKSNVYLISTLIKRVASDTKNLEKIIERLGELAKKNTLSGFKFFSEEDENNREFFEGKVRVMTLHKSKGDEFDTVFLPEMSEKNLTINFDKLTSKISNFMEQLKGLNPDYKIKTVFELKQELVAENLRLLYVAITRAKKKLFITTSKLVKNFNYYKKEDYNKIFEIAAEGCSCVETREHKVLHASEEKTNSER